MWYQECKVYSDGSHYIAIPHTTRKVKKATPKPEELITVVEKKEQPDAKDTEQKQDTTKKQENTDKETNNTNSATQERQMTRKELFEELYEKSKNMPKRSRRKYILDEMKKYFTNAQWATDYVDENIARKRRNLICRRVRLCRKVNLADFNYFCTFTYDGKKLTEEEFQSKLRTCFKMLCHRKHWRYVGVWERSPEKHRLHFHGLFDIPDGTLPGEIIEVNDYSPIKKRVQKTYQCTYFNERFGRSDFSKIDTNATLGAAVAYLIKYIEKSGEKIVYSKNLPQFFISDINEDDVICNIGQEEKKLLLFDDFTCWDEGEYVGPVSDETIAKLRKSN